MIIHTFSFDKVNCVVGRLVNISIQAKEISEIIFSPIQPCYIISISMTHKGIMIITLSSHIYVLSNHSVIVSDDVFFVHVRYLMRCWFIFNWVLGNKFQWNLCQNKTCFIQENECENVIYKMAVVLLMPQSANRKGWHRVSGWHVLNFVTNTSTEYMYINIWYSNVYCDCPSQEFN